MLMGNLDGAPLADPRTIKFRTGKRSKAWTANVVSIGLASGFVEPLESTSIHLVQMGIAHLLTYFPAAGFSDVDRAEYNRLMSLEYEWVRDFIILHYKATERTDTPFWNHVRTMEIPPTLQHRIDLFRTHGRVFREGNELFMKPSWLQVLHGQRVRPQAYHPLTDLIPEPEIEDYLRGIEQVISACVDVMPTHADFIAQQCAAPPAAALAAGASARLAPAGVEAVDRQPAHTGVAAQA